MKELRVSQQATGSTVAAVRDNGQKLGQTLTRMVEDQADGEGRSVDELVQRLADVAEISPGKVREVMAGDVDFPTRRWLEGFAYLLNTDLADLILAADADTVQFRRPEFQALSADEQAEEAIAVSQERRLALDAPPPAPALLSTGMMARRRQLQREIVEDDDGSISSPRVLTSLAPSVRRPGDHRPEDDPAYVAS